MGFVVGIFPHLFLLMNVVLL
uniref:Uncharacterized protein n=1 Tax=Arundo donax TaxID=35708 RepID=A0A0A9AP46_ARUDO